METWCFQAQTTRGRRAVVAPGRYLPVREACEENQTRRKSLFRGVSFLPCVHIPTKPACLFMGLEEDKQDGGWG